MSLEDDSVDCIVTDPPYFRVMTEDWKGEKYAWDKQWDSLEEYLQWFDRVLEQFDRVLRPNGSIYIYADDMIGAHIQVLAEKRFCMLNNIVWKKTNGMNSKYWRNIRKFAPVTERILFMEKMQSSGYWGREYEDLRRPFHIGRNYTDVWESLTTTTMEGGVIHPTQKPVKHIERMIEASTNEGAVVLDPFMGSGTTAVACIRTGRHYVGFEKDPTYYALSQERIEKEKMKRRVVRSIFDYETTEV